MRKLADEIMNDQRAACLAAAAELLTEGGWGAVNTRAIADRIGKSRTFVSDRYSERTLGEALVERAFSLADQALFLPQDTLPLHVGDYEVRLRSLFGKGQVAPILMMRAASMAGVRSGADMFLSLQFFKARGRLQERLTARCRSGERHARQLINWYIAAAVLIHTDPEMAIDELPTAGQVVTGHRLRLSAMI